MEAIWTTCVHVVTKLSSYEMKLFTLQIPFVSSLSQIPEQKTNGLLQIALAFSR